MLAAKDVGFSTPTSIDRNAAMPVMPAWKLAYGFTRISSAPQLGDDHLREVAQDQDVGRHVHARGMARAPSSSPSANEPVHIGLVLANAWRLASSLATAGRQAEPISPVAPTPLAVSTAASASSSVE